MAVLVDNISRDIYTTWRANSHLSFNIKRLLLHDSVTGHMNAASLAWRMVDVMLPLHFMLTRRETTAESARKRRRTHYKAFISHMRM